MLESLSLHATMTGNSNVDISHRRLLTDCSEESFYVIYMSMNVSADVLNARINLTT